MKKVLWALVAGVFLGESVQASEDATNIDKRLEAAKALSNAVILKKLEQGSNPCTDEAQNYINDSYIEKQEGKRKKPRNKKIATLWYYQNAFKYAYGVVRKEVCSALPDITAKGFYKTFKKDFDFEFPNNLPTRMMIDKEGEFLNNVFAQRTESRLGFGLNTKILPLDQINKVIEYFKPKSIKPEQSSSGENP